MNTRKLMGWLVLGGLALLASVAHADFNNRDHGTHYQNASTGLKTDATGNLKTVDDDRDRDFPLITPLFTVASLSAGQTYSMPLAVSSMQYTRAAIMLTWAVAAADTDSVRIAVRVYGTTSSASANYYSWTPGGLAATDSCNGTGYVAADTATGSPQRCLAPNISFWVQKAPYMSTASPSLSYLASNITQGASVQPAAGQIKLRKIPLSIVRFASANGVMLNLTDNYGSPCPFPYIRIEITNAGRQTLTMLQADLWPRVQ